MNWTAAAPEEIRKWYSNDTTCSLNEWWTYPRMTLQRNKTIFQWLGNIVLTTMEENQALLKVKKQNRRIGEIWDDHGFNWYVALCSFLEVQWCFKGNLVPSSWYLILMEAASPLKCQYTSVRLHSHISQHSTLQYNISAYLSLFIS